jgi:hypothetical protein
MCLRCCVALRCYRDRGAQRGLEGAKRVNWQSRSALGRFHRTRLLAINLLILARLWFGELALPHGGFYATKSKYHDSRVFKQGLDSCRPNGAGKDGRDHWASCNNANIDSKPWASARLCASGKILEARAPL